MSVLGGLTSQLKIIAVAEDRASKVLQGVSSELDKVRAEAERTRITNIALGASLMAVGTASLLAGKSMFDSASRVESLNIAFSSLKGSSQLSLEALKKAAMGTVSEVDALAAANQAMMLGIDPDFLPQMMEVARATAVAMGIDTTFAFESIARGVGRQSKLILDNIGIVFDANQAYAEYAQILGKSASELSEDEKKQAYLNKTLEIGMQRMKELGVSSDTSAAAQQRLSASVEDLKSQFGAALLPILTPIINGLAAMTGLFNALPAPVKAVLSVTVLLGGAVATLTGAYILFNALKMGDALTAIANSTVYLTAKKWLLIAAEHAHAAALVILHALEGPYGWAILATAAAVGVAAIAYWKLTESERAATEKAEEAVAVTKEVDEGAQSAAQSINELSAAINSQNLAMSRENKILALGQMYFKQFTRASGDFQRGIDAAMPSVIAFIKAQDWGGLANLVDSLATKYGAGFGDIVSAIEGATEAAGQMIWNNDEAEASYYRLQVTLGIATDAYNDLNDALSPLQRIYDETAIQIMANEVAMGKLQAANITGKMSAEEMDYVMQALTATYGADSAEVAIWQKAMADGNITVGESETAIDDLAEGNAGLTLKQQERQVEIGKLNLKMGDEKDKMDETIGKQDELKENYGGLTNALSGPGGLNEVLGNLTTVLAGLIPEGTLTDLDNANTKFGTLRTLMADWPAELKTKIITEMDTGAYEEMFKKYETTGLPAHLVAQYPFLQDLFEYWKAKQSAMEQADAGAGELPRGRGGGVSIPMQRAMESPEIISQPTHILAGEAGSEVIMGTEKFKEIITDILAVKGRPIVNTIVLQVDGRELARVVDRRLAE